MLAVQPISLADALLFGPPRFLPRKHQCLRLAHGHASSFTESASFTESDAAYHVTLPVPGVRTSDISASVEECTLRLKGETKTQHRHACFDRSISLPKDANVNSEGIELVHKDGILMVSVPKCEPCYRQLEISTPDPFAAEVGGEALAALDDSSYCVSLSMPGVRTSDIRAKFEEYTLRITGETKHSYHTARFDRSIVLPKDADIASEAVKLVHEDGILTIAVPKREPYRKQLEISTSSPAEMVDAGEARAVRAPTDAAEPSNAPHVDV